MNRRNFLTTAGLIAASLPFNSFAQETKPAAAEVTLRVADIKRAQPEKFQFTGFSDKNGKGLTSEDIAGKFLLIYGGYPECEGVCPGAAESLVGAMNELKKNHPDIADKIVPIAVIIQNTSGTLQERTAKWQDDNLQGEKTGIRVIGSTNQADIERFKTTFGITVTPQGRRLVHSPRAYLFGADGTLLHTMKDGRANYRQAYLQTQDGAGSMIKDLKDRIVLPEPTASAVATPAGAQPSEP